MAAVALDAPLVVDVPNRGRRLPRPRVVLSWLLVLGAIAFWVMFLRPAALGGATGYVMVSGKSMEPLMHTGDLAIVRRQRSYGVGDVVAYRVPDGNVGRGMVVIHRVSGGDGKSGYILRGDNRDRQDAWRPRTNDVVGRLQWHLPHAGTALFLIRSPLVIAAVAGFLAFWTIAAGGTPSPGPLDEPTAGVAAVEDEAGPPDIARPAAPAPAPRVPSYPYSPASRGAGATAGVVLAALAVTSLWRGRKDSRRPV